MHKINCWYVDIWRARASARAGKFWGYPPLNDVFAFWKLGYFTLCANYKFPKSSASARKRASENFYFVSVWCVYAIFAIFLSNFVRFSSFSSSSPGFLHTLPRLVAPSAPSSLPLLPPGSLPPLPPGSERHCPQIELAIRTGHSCEEYCLLVTIAIHDLSERATARELENFHCVDLSVGA